MFFRSSQFALVVFSAALALVASTGCQEQAAPVAEPVSDAATPEESFEEIVASIKEGLELPGGHASGFITSSSSASSRFQVHNTVASNLIAPAKAGEPLRGEIIVSTQSIYSLRKSAEEEAADEESNNNRSTSLLDESEESGSGFSSFDEGLVTESPDADNSGRSDIDSVQRRADKVDRKYELIYQNDRWELVTKIDKAKEASIENAFQRALRLQPPSTSGRTP